MDETRIEPVVRARELALALQRVDLNEVASVFQHLRDFLNQAPQNERGQRQALDRWWQWLATVAGPAASAVQRSGQTARYYGRIEEACRRYLRNVPPGEVAETLGWAIRLARYYRGPGGILPPAPDEADEPIAAPPPEPEKPKTPQIPEIGAIVTWEIVELDESAVVLKVEGFDLEKAIGVIKAADLGGRRYRAGNAARVEVTGVRALRSGRTVVELRPAPKREGA